MASRLVSRIETGPGAALHTNQPEQQQSEKQVNATRPPISPVKRALWNFSSQWFLILLGTGIIAVILHNLDYQFRGHVIISVIVWI